MLFLGAGASIAAGVPSSYDMTRRISSELSKDGEGTRIAHLIRFVIGGLLFQQGVRSNDPFDGVDVEELFNAVTLLSERHRLEVAPFVGTWHPLVDSFDQEDPSSAQLARMSQSIAQAVADAIGETVPRGHTGFLTQDIDRSISDDIAAAIAASSRAGRVFGNSGRSAGRVIANAISTALDRWRLSLRNLRPRVTPRVTRGLNRALSARASLKAGGQVYASTASRMIDTLSKLTWITDPQKVTYLRPLFKANNGTITIATLNYDNTVELACTSSGTNFTTHIDQWTASGDFSRRKETNLLLLKLHGSIDWELQQQPNNPNQPMPRTAIRQMSSEEVQSIRYKPAVIFGQRNKLTAEGPYLELLRTFQAELTRSDRLTVIGYSFRDNHINEYMSQWLNSSTTNKLRIVDPRFSQSTSEFVLQMRERIASRLEIIEKPADQAILQLY